MSTPVLEIVRPGLCTTYQDLGRPGHARLGIAPSGALDRLAHQLANLLVGNLPGTVALELTGPGVELLCLRDLHLGLAGADLGAALDGVALDAIASVYASAGARLRFSSRRSGTRVSVAIGGGLRVDPILGSAATDLAGQIGGGPLRAGHRLWAQSEPAANPSSTPDWTATQLTAALAPLRPFLSSPDPLRYIVEDDRGISAEAHAAFTARTFRLSARSNRTGFRLEGDPLPTRPDPDRLSEPTAPGALQLPPDGHPILLMADRNTTGGYPRLGHLATVDLPRAAQLWPGEAVRFRAVSIDEALAALRAQDAALATVAAALSPRRRS